MENNNVKYAFENLSDADKTSTLNQEYKLAKVGDQLKFAGQIGSSLLRKNVFEESFIRKLFMFDNFTPGTDKRLVPLLNSDYPAAMFNIEPAVDNATTLAFDAAPETLSYYGPKGLMKFFKISTPEYKKSKVQIDTYSYDIHKLMQDGAMKNIAKQEDYVGTILMERCVQESQQQYNFAGGTTRDMVTELGNILLRKYGWNIGANLINKVTFSGFANTNRQYTSDAQQGELFEKGISALDGKAIGGMKWIQTIKNDIIPDNTIYTTTEQDYLGVFGELYPTVMYVKKEKDHLSFSAEEVIGLWIGNAGGIVKSTINGASEAYMTYATYPQQKAVKQVIES